MTSSEMVLHLNFPVEISKRYLTAFGPGQGVILSILVEHAYSQLDNDEEEIEIPETIITAISYVSLYALSGLLQRSAEKSLKIIKCPFLQILSLEEDTLQYSVDTKAVEEFKQDYASMVFYSNDIVEFLKKWGV